LRNARPQPVFLVTRAALTAAVAVWALSGCGQMAVVGSPTSPEAMEAAAKKKQSPAKDTLAPTAAGTYYSKVNALSGKALLNGLHALITKGHKEFEYDTARDHMFATVNDLDGDNVVQDVYTGKRVPGVTDRKTAFHRGLNAEHTWPQSMGAKEGPAKADLHHLFPADAGANSQRNNLPFGTVTAKAVMLPDYLGDGLHSRMGENAAGVQVFEPRADHRGDVARAALYFYTRYVVGAKLDQALSIANFRVEYETMLKWHAADPVSALEKARNEAVFKLQANRNPFIDHPEYVKKIGNFLQGAGGKTELAEAL
jgi:endonuclease I